MTIKLGIVMDSLKSVKIEKDSSLAMIIAAQEKSWEIFYMQQSDLYIEGGIAKAKQQKISANLNNSPWYTLGEPEDKDLSELNVILMRKDPPVDSEFIYATHILELAEKAGVFVCNRPQSLRDCNEKLYALEFPQCCPPHLVSRDIKRLSSFLDEHKKVVYKPLDGMGGTSIFQVNHGDSNTQVILETLTHYGEKQIMAQKFLPEIKDGDKRILIVDGKPIPYALARIPSQGEHRGNLAAGGRGEARPLSDRDRWIAEQVKDDILAKGLTFVGIDVIGDYLTEINVTSPTCIQELNRSCNLDIAGQLMDVIEAKLASN